MTLLRAKSQQMKSILISVHMAIYVDEKMFKCLVHLSLLLLPEPFLGQPANRLQVALAVAVNSNKIS